MTLCRVKTRFSRIFTSNKHVFVISFIIIDHINTVHVQHSCLELKKKKNSEVIEKSTNTLH